MAIGDDSKYLSASLNAEQPEQLYFSQGVDRSGNALSKSESISHEQSTQKRTSSKDDFPTYTLKDLTLSILYIEAIGSPLAVWDALKRFFEETESMDTETNSASKVIFGNYYQNPQDCSFLVSVGQLEDTEHSVVDLRRLNGDAFLLARLFENMKTHLSEEEEIEFVENKNSEDLSESDSENFEEEDNTTNKNKLKEFSIDFKNDDEIKFEYDPDLFEMMVNNFQKTHLESVFENKNFTMSLLAFASESEQNRKFMMGGKWLERIKKLIRIQLESTKNLSDAALTRNTCVFLKNMVKDMEIDHETLVCVIKAMAKWCPGQEDGRHIGCLQSSRQVLVEVDGIFQNITEHGPFSDKQIEKIMNEELTPEELERICDYVSRSTIEFGSGVIAELQATI